MYRFIFRVNFYYFFFFFLSYLTSKPYQYLWVNLPSNPRAKCYMNEIHMTFLSLKFLWKDFCPLHCLSPNHHYNGKYASMCVCVCVTLYYFEPLTQKTGRLNRNRRAPEIIWVRHLFLFYMAKHSEVRNGDTVKIKAQPVLLLQVSVFSWLNGDLMQACTCGKSN